MLGKYKCHSFINRSALLLICALSIFLVSNAQEVRVIDNKGTINSIRNNQVTTAAVAPATPLEGDVWFNNTVPTNVITNIWNGSVWVIISGGGSGGISVSADSNNALVVGSDNGAYKALRLLDVYDSSGGQFIDGFLVQLNLDVERANVGFATISNDEVTIPEDGYYKVEYHATFRTEIGDGSRTTARVELQINNTREAGTDSYSYHRQNNNANNHSGNVSSSTAGRSLIKFFNSGDTISLHAVRFEGPTNREFRTLADGTGITVHKLN